MQPDACGIARDPVLFLCGSLGSLEGVDLLSRFLFDGLLVRRLGASTHGPLARRVGVDHAILIGRVLDHFPASLALLHDLQAAGAYEAVVELDETEVWSGMVKLSAWAIGKPGLDGNGRYE